MEVGTDYQPHLIDEKTEGEKFGQGHPVGLGVPSVFPGHGFVQLPTGSGRVGVRGERRGLELR